MENTMELSKKKIKNGTTMKVTQSCLTLCDPVDCSWPGSCGAGYWNGLYLSNLGIKPRSPALQADFTDWATREASGPAISLMYIYPK